MATSTRYLPFNKPSQSPTIFKFAIQLAASNHYDVMWNFLHVILDNRELSCYEVYGAKFDLVWNLS